MSKTKEQNFLQSWTPDYTNEKGEQFYESGKVAIILSEYAQIKDREIDYKKQICNGKDIRCDNPSMDRNGNCRNCQGDMQTIL